MKRSFLILLAILLITIGCSSEREEKITRPIVQETKKMTQFSLGKYSDDLTFSEGFNLSESVVTVLGINHNKEKGTTSENYTPAGEFLVDVIQDYNQRGLEPLLILEFCETSMIYRMRDSENLEDNFFHFIPREVRENHDLEYMLVGTDLRYSQGLSMEETERLLELHRQLYDLKTPSGEDAVTMEEIEDDPNNFIYYLNDSKLGNKEKWDLWMGIFTTFVMDYHFNEYFELPTRNLLSNHSDIRPAIIISGAAHKEYFGADQTIISKKTEWSSFIGTRYRDLSVDAVMKLDNLSLDEVRDKFEEYGIPNWYGMFEKNYKKRKAQRLAGL